MSLEKKAGINISNLCTCLFALIIAVETLATCFGRRGKLMDNDSRIPPATPGMSVRKQNQPEAKVNPLFVSKEPRRPVLNEENAEYLSQRSGIALSPKMSGVYRYGSRLFARSISPRKYCRRAGSECIYRNRERNRIADGKFTFVKCSFWLIRRWHDGDERDHAEKKKYKRPDSAPEHHDSPSRVNILEADRTCQRKTPVDRHHIWLSNAW